jgi:uncharacterized membrane protein
MKSMTDEQNNVAKPAVAPLHDVAADELEERKEARAIAFERIGFFSDAVIAIAITLLALEIRLPAHEGEISNLDLFHSLLSIWHLYSAFIVSFIVIGLTWVGHHKRFELIKRYDNWLLGSNLLFLMVIAFIPFPTAVLAEYGGATATILYAGTMVALGAISVVQWRYVSKGHRLLHSYVTEEEISHEMRAGLVLPIVFMLSILIAFVSPVLAKISWLLVIFGLLWVQSGVHIFRARR